MACSMTVFGLGAGLHPAAAMSTCMRTRWENARPGSSYGKISAAVVEASILLLDLVKQAEGEWYHTRLLAPGTRKRRESSAVIYHEIVSSWS